MLTCATHSSSASTVASIAARPCARKWVVHSAIQSTGCSIDTIMLLSTEGLPGPVIVKRLGNLLELVRERVRVLHALDVAAGAGIAIPVPGASDPVARLEDARREPERARAMEHVEPRES